MEAYIVLSCEQNTENDLYDKALAFEEVIGGHLLFGEWDMILKVKTASNESLTTFIIDKLRKLDGVKLTQTYIIAR
jgi:DNA-binding Lrp family transcriptional regulator